MKRPMLWLALACHLFFATCYLVLTPTFEGPDESEHLRAAWYLANARRLPSSTGYAKPDDTPLDIDPRANQGPLYYGVIAAILAATVERGDMVFAFEHNQQFTDVPGRYLLMLHGGDEPSSPGRSLLLGLRFVSVVIGLLSIVLVHRLGTVTCPERPMVADTAAWLLACSSMWSFQHSVLSNDNLATLQSTGAIVVLAHVARGADFSIGRAVAIGAFAATALLSKITAWFVFALIPLTALVCMRRPGASIGRILRSLAVCGVTAGVIVGPWLVRNVWLYGDLLAMNAHDATYTRAIPPEFAWAWVMYGFPQQAFESFVGRFGWFTFRPHPAMVIAGAATAIAAVVGLAMLIRRRAGPRPMWLLFAAIGLMLGGMVWFNLSQPQPQARLMCPAIGPIAVLLAAGLLRFGDAFPKLAGPWWWAVPPAVGAIVLFAWFAPVFDAAHAPAERHRASIVTGLRSEVADPGIQWVAPLPGSPSSSPPTLHWVDRQATPDAVYSLYVHDDDGRLFLAAFEWGYPARGGTFTLPDGAWAFVPRDRDVLLQLRRVPDWRAGETLASTSASSPLRFRRT